MTSAVREPKITQTGEGAVFEDTSDPRGASCDWPSGFEPVRVDWPPSD